MQIFVLSHYFYISWCWKLFPQAVGYGHLWCYFINLLCESGRSQMWYEGNNKTKYMGGIIKLKVFIWTYGNFGGIKDIVSMIFMHSTVILSELWHLTKNVNIHLLKHKKIIHAYETERQYRNITFQVINLCNLLQCLLFFQHISKTCPFESAMQWWTCVTTYKMIMQFIP